MKTLIFAFVTIVVLLSCKQNSGNKGVIAEDKSTMVKSVFAVDSLKVEDSVAIGKTLKLHSFSKVLLFPNIQNKSLLDSIYNNAGIQLSSYSKENLQKELIRQKDQYFSKAKEDSKEYTPNFEQTWDENSHMKVFSNKNEILTLIYENGGFSGGAHGYYGIFYKNFDLKNNKTIQLSDIFKDSSKMNWNDILKSHFTDQDQKEMLLEERIPVNNNFYFDENKITFVYNQYEIAAYAAGVIEIPVPFSELKPNIKPEFILRNNIIEITR